MTRPAGPWAGLRRDPASAIRIPTLDGLRGVLACVVVLNHLCQFFGTSVLVGAAEAAVGVFFLMSAHVLTRAWDGDMARFLARRLVRLWPVYALCLSVGALQGHGPAEWSYLLCYPLGVPAQDPPGWSLILEARAMLAMPALVWCTRGPVWRLGVGAGVCVALTAWHPLYLYSICFLIGSALCAYVPVVRVLERPAPQWLGKISYSLYLSHWLVLQAGFDAGGPAGAMLAVPVAFAVGWAVWWAVERPSIRFSRRFIARNA